MAEVGSGMHTFLYTNPGSALSNRALIEAFERAGLQFIPENGGGPGVRLRYPIPGRQGGKSGATSLTAENSEPPEP